MKEVLQATVMKLRSDVIKAEANLNNLLERPVGIGEHVDLAADVERLFLDLLEKKHLLKEAEDYLYPDEPEQPEWLSCKDYYNKDAKHD